MTYNIYRTTYIYYSKLKDNKPCEKAYKGEPDRWGDIQWYIDIDSLDDIQALIDEVGEDIIIKKDGEIEIYDDYRE